MVENVVIEVPERHKLFLRHIPRGGRILDAGFDSGRDTLIFRRMGELVIPLESTPKADDTTRGVGSPTRLQLNDIDWVDEFDGIWLSASLLYLDIRDMPSAIARFSRALKPNGVLYMAFKYGTNGHRQESCPVIEMDEEGLSALIEPLHQLEILNLWHSDEWRDGYNVETWLNTIVQRRKKRLFIGFGRSATRTRRFSTPSLFRSALYRRSLWIATGYAAYMLISCVGFLLIDGYPLFDAAYFSMMILTRLTFGELHPLSRQGRIFTFFLGFCSLLLLGVTLATVVQAIFALESRRGRDPKSLDPVKSSPAPFIFICYRRDDSAAYAGRIYDRLGRVYGTDKVIVDVETINPGQDFVQAIERTISTCDVLIALINRNWAGVLGSQGRRIDDERDFVRLELASALAGNKAIIPVLLDEATMPDAASLPGDLRILARRQAHHIRHASFDRDVDRLIDLIDRITWVPGRTP